MMFILGCALQRFRVRAYLADLQAATMAEIDRQAAAWISA
jgi:hypothetical protein